MLEDKLKTLIKILEESNIDELEVSTFWGKQTIRIRKQSVNSGKNIEIIQNEPAQSTIEPPDLPLTPEIIPESENSATETIDADSNQAIEIISPGIDQAITIKAPLVGTYYGSPKPDSPPFIKVGDIIKEGQVICIIEAMKIFNEIESELSGKVIKILIQDATPVEYDQDLIIVAPE
jgi:acetyl-CoA carboxylase biotin carboxyl carrier protein